MISNLERYKKDLENLINYGGMLLNAMQYECFPKEFLQEIKKGKLDDQKTFIAKLPDFKNEYQTWYTESLTIINIIIPDRINDFIGLYKKPHGRKTIQYGNYVIEDYLQGLTLKRLDEKVLGPEAAIPQFKQQLNILKSTKRRFESSLFNIKQLIQADLFDSELESAKELNDKGFIRGAGAIAGVVLEKHLRQVSENHNLKCNKKKPTINDWNEILKDKEIIEILDWRFIQRLGDLRNLCDHDKKREPTQEEVYELIEGVDKIIKRIF